MDWYSLYIYSNIYKYSNVPFRKQEHSKIRMNLHFIQILECLKCRQILPPVGQNNKHSLHHFDFVASSTTVSFCCVHYRNPLRRLSTNKKQNIICIIKKISLDSKWLLTQKAFNLSTCNIITSPLNTRLNTYLFSSYSMSR